MLKKFPYLTTLLVLLAVVAGSLLWFSLAQAQSNDEDVLSRESVWNDPEIPPLGNSKGDLTIVEYFDYQCPVCKVLHPELSRVVREDGRVRLVSKVWPIFGDASVYAARIVLAAKYQGKFAEAHEALFTAKAPLNETVIRALLSKAGVNVAKATADLTGNRNAVDAALARNQTQTRAFGFLGTPAFVVGTFRVEGGLDATNFKKVIAEARAAQAKP